MKKTRIKNQKELKNWMQKKKKKWQLFGRIIVLAKGVWFTSDVFSGENFAIKWRVSQEMKKSWTKTLCSRWGDRWRMLYLYTSCRWYRMKPTKHQQLLIPVHTFLFPFSCNCIVHKRMLKQNFNHRRNPCKLSYTRLQLTNYSLEKPK